MEILQLTHRSVNPMVKKENRVQALKDISLQRASGRICCYCRHVRQRQVDAFESHRRTGCARCRHGGDPILTLPISLAGN